MNWDKTIVCDLDGTICEIKEPNESYLDVKPKEGAIEALKLLKLKGWRIIIDTARGMGSYNNNIGEVNKNRLPELFEWLGKWDIPYDEIHMGKPLGYVYIDDKAIKFNNWKDIINEISI